MANKINLSLRTAYRTGVMALSLCLCFSLVVSSTQVPPREGVVSQREVEKPREAYEKNGITLLLFGDESYAAVAISVNQIMWPKVDRVIVAILYETFFGEIPIVRVKESVIEAMDGVLVMADSVPVSPDKVRNVRITLIREITKTEFDLREE